MWIFGTVFKCLNGVFVDVTDTLIDTHDMLVEYKRHIYIYIYIAQICGSNMHKQTRTFENLIICLNTARLRYLSILKLNKHLCGRNLRSKIFAKLNQPGAQH